MITEAQFLSQLNILAEEAIAIGEDSPVIVSMESNLDDLCLDSLDLTVLNILVGDYYGIDEEVWKLNEHVRLKVTKILTMFNFINEYATINID